MRTSMLVVIAACGGAPAGVRPEAAAARGVCDGLDDEACQERVLVQGMCLQAPDGDGCDALRRQGLLPAPPPALDAIAACWAVEEPRGDRPAAWICIGARDVAVRGSGGWDVWPHGGWRREDTVRRAGWVAERAGGPPLWLTYVREDGHELVARPGTAVLHLADDTGALSARLVAGDPGEAARVADARARLPAPAAVCEAARACLAAIPRPPPLDESELEQEPAPDPLAGAHTLRACERAWRIAADDLALQRLVQSERAPIPPACGTGRPADDGWYGPWPPPADPAFVAIDPPFAIDPDAAARD